MKIEKIAISSHERILFINLYDILYCQSENSSINIYLIDGTKHTIIKPLIQLQRKLSFMFVRVTQSTVINKLHLESIERKEKRLIMKGNKEIQFTMSIGKLMNRIEKISTEKLFKDADSEVERNESVLENM